VAFFYHSTLIKQQQHTSSALSGGGENAYSPKKIRFKGGEQEKFPGSNHLLFI